MKKTGVCILLVVALLFGAFLPATAAGPKEADPETGELNSRLPPTLSADDREESEFSIRGLIAAEPFIDIRGDGGKPVWDTKRYDFLEVEPTNPATVPAALWRHARRNAQHGLFRVTDGIYQVRGYDIANITFIAGKTGYIVVDPLTSVETARAALELLYRYCPIKPVVAAIYTHSHVDHWVGVRGIITAEEVASGKVRIIAPAGMVEEAVNENVLAGNAMARRAAYMFGNLLPKGPKGQVDAGIGKAVSTGTVSLIPPTEEIATPVQEMTIDGVRFVFQQTPGTEAPVEMNFHLPDLKALCIAENVSAGLHNLLTPRGALVRDGRAWARFIDEAIDRFAGDTEVVFTTHHWPRWGKARIADYMKKQRDLYKYIHDQTVRLMNQGYPPAECAERIQLPPSLAREWFNRDFYGTVNFNVKAVTSATLAGSTAIRPISIRSRPRRRRGSTCSTWAVPAPSSPGPVRTSARVNTAGWLRRSTTWFSQSRKTPRPANSWPMPWSSSATGPNLPSGGISTSPGHRNSATASGAMPHSTGPGLMWSAPCRSTRSSTCRPFA